MPSIPRFGKSRLPEKADHGGFSAAWVARHWPPPLRDDAAMLRDLDLSVAAFLSRVLPAGTAVQFRPPAASWVASSPDAPLLDAFLYDVREPQPPAADAMLTRDEDGHPAGWQRPVRRYLVSYLLTAWPGGGDGAAGEHELLGAVLTGCAVTGAIPADCLQGVLAGTAEPLPLVCAAPDRVADAAQLWAALGVPARTALDLSVVAPVVPPLLTDLAPAIHSLEIGIQRPPPAQPATRQPQPDGWHHRHITET
jgi:Pvc16 N-terminal domain